MLGGGGCSGVHTLVAATKQSPRLPGFAFRARTAPTALLSLLLSLLLLLFLLLSYAFTNLIMAFVATTGWWLAPLWHEFAWATDRHRPRGRDWA